MPQHEITYPQAIALSASRWWEDRPAREIAEFQSYVNRACCPFEIWVQAVRETLDLSDAKARRISRPSVRQLLLGDQTPAKFQEIMEVAQVFDASEGKSQESISGAIKKHRNQLTSAQAGALEQSKWWEGRPAREIAEFQSWGNKDCCPRMVWIEAVRETLNLSYSHAGRIGRDHVREQLLGDREPTAFKEIMSLIADNPEQIHETEQQDHKPLPRVKEQDSSEGFQNDLEALLEDRLAAFTSAEFRQKLRQDISQLHAKHLGKDRPRNIGP